MGVVWPDDAAARVKQAEQEAGVGGSADNYGVTNIPSPPSDPSPSPETPDTEPADPDHVDQETRRQTRIAPSTFETDDLAPFIECGCGNCPAYVDPLGPTKDPHYRQMKPSSCPDPRPVTVEKAREIYLRYERSARDTDDKRTPRLMDARDDYGRVLGAERDLLAEYDGLTLIFLSLRLSPVESEGDERRWVPPVQLVERLNDAWRNVRGRIDDHLDGVEYEWVAITAPTETAATPHRHVVVYVEDPDDEVTVDVAKAAVESHIRGTKGAEPDDHPVKGGVRDAGIVDHDPERTTDTTDEALCRVMDERGETRFAMNTVLLKYAATQLPHFVLENVDDDDHERHQYDPLVDGAAIAWASSHDWLSSSGGFPT